MINKRIDWKESKISWLNFEEKNSKQKLVTNDLWMDVSLVYQTQFTTSTVSLFLKYGGPRRSTHQPPPPCSSRCQRGCHNFNVDTHHTFYPSILNSDNVVWIKIIKFPFILDSKVLISSTTVLKFSPLSHLSVTSPIHLISLHYPFKSL